MTDEEIAREWHASVLAKFHELFGERAALTEDDAEWDEWNIQQVAALLAAAEERGAERARGEDVDYFLSCRGIDSREDVCSGCGGMGVRTYGSTATWRGGVGGQVITSDVCDRCWGSGHKDRKWPSHRALRSKP